MNNRTYPPTSASHVRVKSVASKGSLNTGEFTGGHYIGGISSKRRGNFLLAVTTDTFVGIIISLTVKIFEYKLMVTPMRNQGVTEYKCTIF